MKLICQLKVQTELNLSFFLKYECSVHRILYITESCKQAEAEVVPSSSLVKIRMSLRLSLRLRLKLKRLRSLRLKLRMLRLRLRLRLRLVWVKIYTSTVGWLGRVGGEMGIKANLSQCLSWSWGWASQQAKLRQDCLPQTTLWVCDF